MGRKVEESMQGLEVGLGASEGASADGYDMCLGLDGYGERVTGW